MKAEEYLKIIDKIFPSQKELESFKIKKKDINFIKKVVKKLLKRVDKWIKI